MKRLVRFTTEIQILYGEIVLLCVLTSPSVFGLSVSTGPNGCNAQAVHAAGYTGQGINVGLISQDHARYTHEAFAGHAHWYDATDQNNYVPSSHDTSVGGIICSRGGASYPNDKGVAPDAELYSVKVVRPDGEFYVSSIPWMDDALKYFLQQQCRVVVTGIQLGGTANGTSDWSLIYDYYAYQHNLVFAAAAGNYEPSITIFGDTYNSITTGGLVGTTADLYDKVGSQSNSGPTVDGRKKPEIAAPSQGQWTPQAGSDVSWNTALPDGGGQTSWSVPHTGGVAAVLLSYADTTAEPDDGKNVVIKAAIVNSTFPNIMSKPGAATTGLIWQADRGYGRLDGFRAYQTLNSPRILPSMLTNNSKGWGYAALSAGQYHTYTIEGLKNERLITTVTWNRRIQWNDQNNPNRPGYGIIENGELVGYPANLDLQIRDPDGTVLISNLSTIDNLDKADLLLTRSGNYEVKVVNQSGSESAAYGLAFELLPPLEADFNMDYVVDEQDLIEFVSYWMNTDCTNPPQLCYPYNLSPNGRIDLSDFSILADRWLTYDSRYYTP